jgi:hypothetical protein
MPVTTRRATTVTRDGKTFKRAEHTMRYSAGDAWADTRKANRAARAARRAEKQAKLDARIETVTKPTPEQRASGWGKGDKRCIRHRNTNGNGIASMFCQACRHATNRNLEDILAEPVRKNRIQPNGAKVPTSAVRLPVDVDGHRAGRVMCRDHAFTGADGTCKGCAYAAAQNAEADAAEASTQAAVRHTAAKRATAKLAPKPAETEKPDAPKPAAAAPKPTARTSPKALRKHKPVKQRGPNSPYCAACGHPTGSSVHLPVGRRAAAQAEADEDIAAVRAAMDVRQRRAIADGSTRSCRNHRTFDVNCAACRNADSARPAPATVTLTAAEAKALGGGWKAGDKQCSREGSGYDPTCSTCRSIGTKVDA